MAFQASRGFQALADFLGFLDFQEHQAFLEPLAFRAHPGFLVLAVSAGIQEQVASPASRAFLASLGFPVSAASRVRRAFRG